MWGRQVQYTTKACDLVFETDSSRFVCDNNRLHGFTKSTRGEGEKEAEDCEC